MRELSLVHAGERRMAARADIRPGASDAIKQPLGAGSASLCNRGVSSCTFCGQPLAYAVPARAEGVFGQPYVNGAPPYAASFGTAAVCRPRGCIIRDTGAQGSEGYSPFGPVAGRNDGTAYCRLTDD